MNFLEEKILKDGIIKPGNILKIDNFLNHQIDIDIIRQIAYELKRRFRGVTVNKILTIEASGIAIATMLGEIYDVPVVFAKKSATVVQDDNTVQAPVYSFTHKTQNMIRIEKQYLPEGARVLIIDDFIADGQAARGLINLCWQQGATVVGVGIAVEKGFQPGGKALRESGIHLKSLAVVDGIVDGNIVLRPEDD